MESILQFVCCISYSFLRLLLDQPTRFCFWLHDCVVHQFQRDQSIDRATTNLAAVLVLINQSYWWAAANNQISCSVRVYSIVWITNRLDATVTTTYIATLNTLVVVYFNRSYFLRVINNNYNIIDRNNINNIVRFELNLFAPNTVVVVLQYGCIDWSALSLYKSPSHLSL